MQVAVFRKDTEGVKYAPKSSAKVLGIILDTLSAVTRFPRPEVIGHFMPTGKGRSAFARQKSVTRPELHHLADCRRAGVLTPEAKATLAKAWIVPAGELGRAPKGKERDWNSTAQSILIFLKDRVGTIAADNDVTVVAPDGSDLSVIVID